MALPPPQLDAPPTQALNIAAVKASSKSISQPAFDGITSNQPDIHRQQDQQLNLDRDELMIDSGAATHVCPIWFAATTPIHDLQPHETPNLRTTSEDQIHVYGYKWVYMTNDNNQQIVIPFYLRTVSQPILSVTTVWQNKASQ